MLTNKFQTFLAHQLGFPKGWFGRLLIRFLNRNNAVMNDLVLKVLNLQAGDRVLEIGFGGGYLFEQIANTGLASLIVGIERSQDAIDLCRQTFRDRSVKSKQNNQVLDLEFCLADAANLPFPEAFFNQICTVNTIYFWSEPAKVLAECFRVLNDKGKLVISYNSKKFLEQQKFSEHGLIAYEVSEVEKMLSMAGFENIITIAEHSNRHQEFFCTSATKRST